jgi:hypothetical protein
LSFELDAKIQSPLRSHTISLAIEYRIAREAAESFAAAGAVLPLFIICGITVELFITSLFVSAIVGISILFILPDKISVVSSSSFSLFSSWLNDGMFRPDMQASNPISRIERVLLAIVEEDLVLRLMLGMKKRWLVIVFRGFRYH